MEVRYHPVAFFRAENKLPCSSVDAPGFTLSCVTLRCKERKTFLCSERSGHQPKVMQQEGLWGQQGFPDSRRPSCGLVCSCEGAGSWGFGPGPGPGVGPCSEGSTLLPREC